MGKCSCLSAFKKSFTPFTASVLTSLMLFSCMTQAPVLNQQAPKGSFSIQNVKHSLVPQDTVYFYSNNPLNATLPGFQTQALPKDSGCSGGCVNSLSAVMSWAAPGFAPQGDTLTLETLQSGSNLSYGFGYGLNVLERGVDSQGQAIATRIRAGTSAHRTTYTGGSQNYTRHEHLEMELTSTDGIHFNFDSSKASYGDMDYIWTLPASAPGTCNQAAWGGTGYGDNVPIKQAVLTLNPLTQSAHLQASFSNPLTYAYLTGDGVPPSCTAFYNQLGMGQGSIDIDFLVLFEVVPQPTPTPLPTPTPTPVPTPTPNPTPTPVPSPSPSPIEDCGCEEPGFAIQAVPLKKCNCRLFPKKGQTSCQSVQRKFKLSLVYDFDPTGPDITLIVTPNQKGLIDDRLGAQNLRVTSNRTPDTVDLLHHRTPDQIDTQNANPKSPNYQKFLKKAQLAKDMWQEALRETVDLKKRQKLINDAVNIQMTLDESSNVMDKGSSLKAAQEIVDYYLDNLANSSGYIALADIVNDCQQIPNLFELEESLAYALAIDMDKQGQSIVGKTGVGQTTELKIHLSNGDYIPIIVKKNLRSNNTINWGVSCQP